MERLATRISYLYFAYISHRHLMDKKVILLTGASSGIGYQTAKDLASLGHAVYAVARRLEQMEPLKAYGVLPLRLDITDAEACREVVDDLIRREGRLDVLINNAGYGLYGAVEEVSLQEARQVFEVNVFALSRLTQLVLPQMRQQGGGRIINLSSIAGRVATPFGAWYHATKFAVEGLSDALRLELAPHGIDVVLIEPGGIKTDFGDLTADELEAVSRGGAYEAEAGCMAGLIRRLYHGGLFSSPEIVSRAIVSAVQSKRPRARYLIGFGARPLFCLHRLLPARWYDRLIRWASLR